MTTVLLGGCARAGQLESQAAQRHLLQDGSNTTNSTGSGDNTQGLTTPHSRQPHLLSTPQAATRTTQSRPATQSRHPRPPSTPQAVATTPQAVATTPQGLTTALNRATPLLLHRRQKM
jgi:hypothetical protein